MFDQDAPSSALPGIFYREQALSQEKHIRADNKTGTRTEVDSKWNTPKRLCG